jgi:hypothetical protein
METSRSSRRKAYPRRMLRTAQQSTNVLRTPRRLVTYTTAFRSSPGGGGDSGDAFGSRTLLLIPRSIFSWNAVMRARTMPDSSGMPPVVRVVVAGDIGVSTSLLFLSRCAAGFSSADDTTASCGGDGGVSDSRASRNPDRISGSKSMATAMSISTCIHGGRDASSERL